MTASVAICEEKPVCARENVPSVGSPVGTGADNVDYPQDDEETTQNGHILDHLHKPVGTCKHGVLVEVLTERLLQRVPVNTGYSERY